MALHAFRRPHGRPLVLGHRGIPLEYQENTLAGFRRAAELGIDGVELDVFLLADDQLVVFHDENLRRLCGIDARIQDQRWDDLQHVRLAQRVEVQPGHWHTYNVPQPLCRLETVLRELGDKLLFNIEMKAFRPQWARRRTGRAVGALVDKLQLQERAIVTSFDIFMLRDLERHYPDIHSGFAFDASMLGRHARWLRRLPEWRSELAVRDGNQNNQTLLNTVLESRFISRFVHASVVGTDYRLLDTNTVARMQQHGLTAGCHTLYAMPQSAATLYEQDSILRALYNAGIHWVECDDPLRATSLLDTWHAANEQGSANRT